MKLFEVKLDPLEKEVRFLKKQYGGIADDVKYTFENGMVNVDGPVFLSNTNIFKLPFKFGTVKEVFNIHYTKISSVENFPSEVIGHVPGAAQLVFSHCNRLTSLRGIHKVVKRVDGRIFLNGTPLKEAILGLILIEGVKEVRYMEDMSDFKLHGDRIKALQIVIKHMGHGRSGVIAAQHELMEAGLDAYAEL